MPYNYTKAVTVFLVFFTYHSCIKNSARKIIYVWMHKKPAGVCWWYGEMSSVPPFSIMSCLSLVKSSTLVLSSERWNSALQWTQQWESHIRWTFSLYFSFTCSLFNPASLQYNSWLKVHYLLVHLYSGIKVVLPNTITFDKAFNQLCISRLNGTLLWQYESCEKFNK